MVLRWKVALVDTPKKFNVLYPTGSWRWLYGKGGRN